MGVKWTDAQLDAINSRDRTMLVCAAAGSGKTATLTERIIRRLTDKTNPSDISRMLVVTFTRNAATELREKIYKALSAELERDPTDKFLSLQLMKLPDARISTIHSFCFDIVKRNAAKLGLGTSVRIGDTAENEIRARRVMEEVVYDFYDREAAEESAFDFAMLSESITSAKGEGTLSEIFLSLYKKLCSYAGGAATLSNVAGDYERVCQNDFFDTRYGEIYKEELVLKLEGFSHKYGICINCLRDENDSHPYLAALYSDLEYIKRVLTAADSGYSAVKCMIDGCTFQKLGTVKRGSATVASENAKILRSELKAEMKRFAEMFAYTPSELDNAAAKTATLSKTLSKVLCEFEQRFREEKKDAGVLDYNDLEYYALRALYDGDERSEAAKELEALTDEIYIDEYQDVNEVQDKIFSAISNGHNLFMVGDVKQSIYSFRGGEPSIFTARRDSYEKYDREKNTSAAPCAVFMQNNFRCDSTVVDYVNGIFACLLGKANGRFEYINEDELVYSKDGGKISENEVYPRLVICENADENTDKSFNPEAAFVADEIVRLLKEGHNNNGKRIVPSDIAILLRSDRASSAVYKRELERRGVPVVSGEKSSPFDSPELQLVLCMLNAIDNPHRDVYLAGVLLSEIYGFTLDELVMIKREYRESLSLYDSLVRYTEAHGFEKGREFIRERDRYRELSKKKPIDKLIWQIYLESSLLCVAVSKYKNVYARRKAKRNCMLVYEYARSFESGASRGLYSFIEYLNGIIRENTFPETSADSYADGVKIMSMHASKGLEFPVCFVCDTARSFNKTDLADRLMYEPQVGIGFKLRGADGFSVTDTPFRRAVSMYRDKLSSEEEMRILYVALTRAREKLYITAKPAGRGGSYEKMIEKASYGAEMFCKTTVSEISNFADGILLATQTEALCVPCERVSVSDKEIPQIFESVTERRESESADNDKVDQMLSTLKKRIDYVYPYRRMTRIKAKMSVSKLYPGVLDEVGESDAENAEIKPLSFTSQPSFMSEERSASAAEKGTATHLIMQFADFSKMQEHGVAAELERLVREGFIDGQSARIANIAYIEKFLDSGFYRRIRSADRLWREFRFNLQLDAALFCEDEDAKAELSGEKLLVQGVIDGFFAEGENIVLFDYKTDYLSEYELSHPEAARAKLSARHAEQLCYYRLALERIFGRRVEEVYIYSLPLGKEVRVDISDEILKNVRVVD